MVLFLCLLLFFTTTTLALNTIPPGQSIKDGETLVSAGGSFELGFFSPRNSKSRYVGIWYKKVSTGTVVWVANRETPVSDASGVLSINHNGILSIMNRTKGIVWSSNTSRNAVEETIAQLLDSGNFVVKDRNDSDPTNFLWQSFDYPCDTFLPGMKLGRNFVTGFDWHISSWKSMQNPAPGLYSIRTDPQGLLQFVLKNGTEILFRAGPWNGAYLSGRTLPTVNPIYSFEFVWNENEIYYEYEVQNHSVYTRYLLNPSGLIQRTIWNERKKDWEVFATSQVDQCSIYAYCGPYATCNTNESPPCKCLEGFLHRSASPEDINSVDWSNGCTRRTPLACEDTSKSWADLSIDLKECEKLCLKNCSCTAYTNLDIREGGRGCLLWYGDLTDISELNEGGQDLYIRLATCEHGKEDLELPLFDFATVATATNNFLSNNILGQGGFGPVYKGTLIEGQEIAVKRLSKNSGQGLEEFKNEVTLISKLQHRNLVKLFGCCIRRDEKMLIYEYMPNKSLDYFIFDQTRSKLLDWRIRMHIIDGIARGVLYLHHDSILRIIHRDLKASNILLDNNMNPKISDFGLARKFGLDQTRAKTRRVVGTYGYMSPEYALDGLFSMKSDVFSFGVLVLEILSGKKNRGFSHPEHDYNLLGHAWTLWMGKRPLELIDTAFGDLYNATEVLRCINVGLLCVQQSPPDRPNMSLVLLMLCGDSVLPQPKQPGFFIERNLPMTDSISEKNEMFSIYESTITSLEPR
ncbi:hypothetical protein ERO13_A01G070800v2 [Gossypium hirsutum]|nr:hypothetical protein ERO13_A01G070800v2 [Gossypium hirsutum]